MNRTTFTHCFRLPLAVALFAASAAVADAQLVFQPTTEAESKDTKIYISTPTTNFSSNLNVVASDITEFDSLLQFTLTGLPAATSISGAYLTLWATGIGANGGTGGNVTVQPILGAWNETAADGGSNPLATYEAFFGTTPTLGLGSIVDTQFIGGAGFVTWDVTNLVKSWADGSLTNNGFFLKAATAGADIGLADVDTDGAAHAPSLTINVVPEPATALSLIGGSALLLGLRRRRPAFSIAQ